MRPDGSASIRTDDRSGVFPTNTRSVLVAPQTGKRRLLVVEGAPGFEHTFLKRALSDDPGLEVDAVVRKGQNDDGRDTFYVQAAPSRMAWTVHSGSAVLAYPSETRVLRANGELDDERFMLHIPKGATMPDETVTDKPKVINGNK